MTVAQAARLQPDSGTGEQEPLRVGLAGGIKCGVELWPIKTLTDPNAAQVQLDPVLPTSIAAVNALQVPADVTTREGDNFELHAYQVTAFLIGYKLEADNDWHVVLSDDGSEAQPHTMIVEIPNPACAQPPLEPTTSRVLSQITQARAAFETAFPPAKACFSCNLKTQVTVIGVGFYDRLHGQHGVAVNGAELHPVIGFEVGGGPPPPVTTTSSTTTQDNDSGRDDYADDHNDRHCADNDNHNGHDHADCADSAADTPTRERLQPLSGPALVPAQLPQLLPPLFLPHEVWDALGPAGKQPTTGLQSRRGSDGCCRKRSCCR